MEETSLTSTVLELYKIKNWREILRLNESFNGDSRHKILWVWPEEKNIIFIKTIVSDFSHKGISSIGCGCGLLEWIISESTGLSVVGYEVNKQWWESKYSNPKFIQLHYVANVSKEELNPEYALLFCYFNDIVAFQEYIKIYKGRLVFIIGPGKGNWKHTDPKPFNADFNSNQWKLYAYQEVIDTEDFIAAYVRDPTD